MFCTYDKYTLHKYEMHVKITYIYKDKAQVILFKKVISYVMFKKKMMVQLLLKNLNFINVPDSFRK